MNIIKNKEGLKYYLGNIQVIWKTAIYYRLNKLMKIFKKLKFNKMSYFRKTLAYKIKWKIIKKKFKSLLRLLTI